MVSRPALSYDALSDRARARLGPLLSYATLIAVLAVIALPMYWMVAGSLKTNDEVFQRPPVWIPHRPRFANYKDAWNAAPFGRFYINTLIITFFGTGIKLINAICTAYALVFLKFPKKNLIFIIILAGLMVPEQITILPNYVTISDIFGHNWINTYQGIIVPGAAIAFGTFLLRQAFLGLPKEVLDAAKVDGCGNVRMLWDMVIPMSRAAIVTVTLLVAVQKWNDFLWPLIVTNEDRMRPLTVGLTYMVNREGNTQWGTVMAAAIFVIVPLLVVFAFAQKLIIQGITAGATKG